MTEKSRAPHKLSVVGAWRRVAAMFRRGSAAPAMTADYRRATEHNRSVQALQREEYGKAAARGFGGSGWGGSGQLPVPAGVICGRFPGTELPAQRRLVNV